MGARIDRSRRTKRTHIAAWLLIFVGLSLLSAWAWEVYGTNALAQSRQQQASTDLRDAWRRGQDAVKVRGSKLTAFVQIPRINKRAVPLVEGTSEADLALGFAHFTGTAGPGQVGNFALAAHRITHGEPLRGMPSLRPGDQVIVQTKQKRYTYVLDTPGDALSVDFSAGWVIEPQPTNPQPGGVNPVGKKRLLTLTTCAELFHTDQRLVAFGHLVKTEAVS